MKRGLIIATSVIGAVLLIALVVVSEIEDVPRNETIRNVGIMLAGLAGLGLGYWRSVTADEQRALRERGLITDRFNKGVENLNSDKPAARLGGIYTLWRLIEEVPSQDKTRQQSEVNMIIQTLTAFVRNYEHGTDEGESEVHKLAADLQTVIKFLGLADAPYRKIMDENYKINLEEADLRHGAFHRIDLSNALAPGVDLSGAFLAEANLSGANMRDANFDGAKLHEANCQGADFSGAHFEKTYLGGTNFEGAGFWGADILDSSFSRANLRNAMFYGASFGHKNSSGEFVISKNVSLEDADITGANFSGAVGLIQEKIDRAVCNPNNPPKLPDGLKPPTRTPKDVEDEEIPF